jgi:hypothetical protein
VVVVEAEVEEEEEEDDVFMTVSEAGNCNSLGKTDDEAWSSRATAMAALPPELPPLLLCVVELDWLDSST